MNKAKKKSQQAAVFIKSFGKDRIYFLKKICKLLKEQHEDVEFSSIYQLKSPHQSNEGLGALCVAAKFITLQTVWDLHSQLKTVHFDACEREDPSPLSIELILLGEKVLITPELTLPHPLLHRVPEYAQTISEILAQFRHPILLVNLEELSSKLAWYDRGEFYERSKSLLDF